MSWFNWGRKEREAVREERNSQHLLKAFLETEQTRLINSANLDKARSELELRRLELEIQHAESLATARTIEMKARDDLKVMRQERAAVARAALAAKKEAAKRQQMELPGTTGACRVCVNQSDPTINIEDLTWHANGHRPGAGLFAH